MRRSLICSVISFAVFHTTCLRIHPAASCSSHMISDQPPQCWTDYHEFVRPKNLIPDLFLSQLKYKQTLKKDSSSLYHLMPETMDTLFARQQTDMLSEVPRVCFLPRIRTLARSHPPGCVFVSSQGQIQRRREEGDERQPVLSAARHPRRPAR